MQIASTTLESALTLSPNEKAIAIAGKSLHTLIIGRYAGMYYSYSTVDPQITTDPQTGEQVTHFKTDTIANLKLNDVYHLLAEEEQIQPDSEIWYVLTEGKAETLASLLGRAPELVRV